MLTLRVVLIRANDAFFITSNQGQLALISEEEVCACNATVLDVLRKEH